MLFSEHNNPVPFLQERPSDSKKLRKKLRGRLRNTERKEKLIFKSSRKRYSIPNKPFTYTRYKIGSYQLSCFHPFLLQYAGSKDDFAQKTNKETQAKLSQLAADVDVHKDKVIKRLLDLVYDIKPEIHVNARLNKNM